MGNGHRLEACCAVLCLWACLLCGSGSAQNLTFDEPEEDPATDVPANAKPETKAESKAKAAAGKAGHGASLKTAPSPARSDATEQESDESPRTMDQLLDGALDGRKPIELAPDKGDSGKSKALTPVPQVPTGPSILAAIKVVAPALRACAQGQPGNVQLMVVLAGNGRAKSARLAGPPFAGTASGRCMEGVLRRARFPRFSRPQFRVRIPLALQ